MFVKTPVLVCRCSSGPSDHIDSGTHSLLNYSADRHGANRHCDSVEDVPVMQQSLLPTVIEKWFVDKGFGFGKVTQAKQSSSMHASCMWWRSAHARHGRVGESNDMVFSELGDSQGSFSCITHSSDLDIDDATLGEMLTEAHRGQADYRSPEGVSVSQSSLSKPVGERDVDQSIDFWCHEKHVQCSQQVF